MAPAVGASLEQLPAVVLSVRAKGFDCFPSEALQACVAVDTLGDDGEPVAIGSGACISKEGLILTAGHVAPVVGCVRRISFASSMTLMAKCIKTGGTQYDLALLQPIHMQHRMGTRGDVVLTAGFPSLQVAAQPATLKAKLVCVGQPGVRAKQRLEANVGKCTRRTKHPLSEQHESGGGMAHSCPVYGGSSGSPLLLGSSGELVGVHIAFDMNKFEAQAVTLEAVRAFILDMVGKPQVRKC